jgi:spermidine synthase
MSPIKNEAIERNAANFFSVHYDISEVLFSGQSPFQKVEVVQTRGHGRMLLNDDLVMITERDEFVYHDMITHVPLFVHPHPRRVLVIGGGDGGTAREVLRHASVEKCDMVEIDGLVVEACRKFIPQTAVGMQSSPRFELFIEDGVRYVRETKNKYDVIIVDSTDPIGPATPLFGIDFYRDVFNCLSPDGIVVSQGESPFYNSETQIAMSKILAQLFPIVRYYNFTNLTYPGGYWSFSFASKALHPIRDFDRSRVANANLSFKYYNADLHAAAFQLPSFQLDHIRKNLKDGPIEQRGSVNRE